MGSEYDAIARVQASIDWGYIDLDWVANPDDAAEMLIIRKALEEYVKNHGLTGEE